MAEHRHMHECPLSPKTSDIVLFRGVSSRSLVGLESMKEASWDLAGASRPLSYATA